MAYHIRIIRRVAYDDWCNHIVASFLDRVDVKLHKELSRLDMLALLLIGGIVLSL